MTRSFIRKVTVLGLFAVLALLVASPIQGQQSKEGKVKVTGAELREWNSKYAVYAGVNHTNGCFSMVANYGDGTREIYWDCGETYAGSGTSKGTYRVVGDQICTKYELARGGQEQCFEVYRVGENEYEDWRDGKYRTHTYYKLK